MPKSTKAANSKPATPAQTSAKSRAPKAADAPAKAAPKRTASPATTKPKQAISEKKPPKVVKRSPAAASPGVTAEQRRCYVEVAAYFIAERHGFTPGRTQEDWVSAEMEIDRMLAEGRLRTA